nr:glycosyltransferase [Gloeocapsopsis dulcis]
MHIIPSVAPIRGGPSRAVLEMVKALQRQGIESEIATTNDNGSGLLEVPLEQQVTYADVPVWFFPRLSPGIAAIREFAVSWSLTNWLQQHLYDYDLLHIHAIFSYPSTIGMAIARQHNHPYLVSPHGLLNRWSLKQQALKKQIYLKLIEQRNLNSSKAVHFTAFAEAQETASLKLIAPSSVIPLGITSPAVIFKAREKLRQKLKLSDSQPILLFLGRIHPKKGLDLLIPALANLRGYQFSLVIAGEGSPDYEQEVHRLIEYHNLSDRTYWLGFVSGVEKDIVLQGSDLFVLTSYSENFGIAVLEALAAGLPVLISDEVALSEVVRQHQVGYVTSLDIRHISEALNQALAGETNLQQMGDWGRQLILEKYTWDRIASNLSEVYTAILKREPIPTLY